MYILKNKKTDYLLSLFYGVLTLLFDKLSKDFSFCLVSIMLQEKLDENALGEATTFWLHAVIIGGIVLFVLLLLFLLLKKAKSKADTFLFVGLNDAGKTVIFSRLINPRKSFANH